jgi:hypothetical protein
VVERGSVFAVPYLAYPRTKPPSSVLGIAGKLYRRHHRGRGCLTRRPPSLPSSGSGRVMSGVNRRRE